MHVAPRIFLSTFTRFHPLLSHTSIRSLLLPISFFWDTLHYFLHFYGTLFWESFFVDTILWHTFWDTFLHFNWDTLCVSYLISLKHLLFENIVLMGFSALYVPGCTWLYSAVPGSALIFWGPVCTVYVQCTVYVYSVCTVYIVQAQSGWDWSGCKSLNASLLRAPLYGVNNNSKSKTNATPGWRRWSKAVQPKRRRRRRGKSLPKRILKVS